MATKAQAQSAIAKRFGTKQDRLDSWPAYLGNEDGTVTGSRANYVYVRYPSVDSAAVEVYNGGVPEVAGLRVMVGYRPEQPNLIQALGVSDVRVEISATQTYGVIRNHANQHHWTGSDPVYIMDHQIAPLAVYTSSGLIVSIYAGNIQRGAAVVEIPAQTLDLTASVPATLGQGRYALITLNAAGVVTATNGALVADYTLLARSDIPTTPAGHFRLAAVRMYNGQTTIVDTATQTDIFDLRWPQEVTAGITAQAVAIVTTNTTLNTAHQIVIVSNGSTITLPTAVGGTGLQYNIIRSGVSNVLINTTSSQTISGDLTLTLIGQWDSVVVVSDGSNWVRCS